MQILQQAGQDRDAFNEDHEVRYVRMNQSHPAK